MAHLHPSAVPGPGQPCWVCWMPWWPLSAARRWECPQHVLCPSAARLGTASESKPATGDGVWVQNPSGVSGSAPHPWSEAAEGHTKPSTEFWLSLGDIPPKLPPLKRGFADGEHPPRVSHPSCCPSGNLSCWEPCGHCPCPGTARLLPLRSFWGLSLLQCCSVPEAGRDWGNAFQSTRIPNPKVLAFLVLQTPNNLTLGQ